MQANREYVFEDPLAPLRLPPLAQISEFWRRYDRLADIHDKKLTTNLNGNLDAALFSAINTTFISITMPDLSPNTSDETNNLLRLLVIRADNNTLTPSDLVPPFTPSVNSIMVNCLLYASLSCSLLAAVGAMMAKEWLQSFDRTGQTGPLEEQARFRQRKFNGVLEWHLEAVIKFLPNLLLLSVIFFFVGICLFLFPINAAVAGIVVAFSGIGVVFSGIVIVAGAVSPTCPYQSAASSTLRRGCRGIAQSWELVERALVRPAVTRTLEGAEKLWKNTTLRIRSLVDTITIITSRIRLWHHRSSSSDDSGGQQTTGHDPAASSPALRVTQLSLASSHRGSSTPRYISTPLPTITEPGLAEDQNLPSATQMHPNVRWIPNGVSQAIERVRCRWERLFRMDIPFPFHPSPAVARTKADNDQVLTVQATRWLLETTSNRGDQISTAQFICSLDGATCAEVFDDYDSWKRLLNLTLGEFEIWSSQPNKENQAVAELFGLVLCRALLQCSKESEKWKDMTDECSREPSRPGKRFLQNIVAASSTYSPDYRNDDRCILHSSFIFTAIQTRVGLKEFQWTNPSCLLDSGSAAAASLLVVWAYLVQRVGNEYAGIIFPVVPQKIAELWTREQDLPNWLSETLERSLECFQSVQGDLDAELDAARGYSFCLQRIRELGPPSFWLHSTRTQGLAKLLWSYIDPLTASGSTDSGLLRLTVEALLTFKTFLPSHSSSSATPTTSSSRLIESAQLIDIAVDVLLDDLISLTSQHGKWTLRGRTFKACIIRILLWIWRNNPNRSPYAWERRELFTSSCRLWAPLEKEVAFSKTGSFNDEDKPLTPDDLKTVIEFAAWVQGETLFAVLDYDKDYKPICLERSAFIARNADVGINRLYAHFDRRAEWQYHLYDFYEDGVSCSRSIYREDGML